MTAFNNQRNMVLSKAGVLVAWILSLLGISVGNFGCTAYGPGDHEEIYQLNDLKKEVIELEKSNRISENEILKLKAEIDNKSKSIINFQEEIDSLKILLGNFDN